MTYKILIADDEREALEILDKRLIQEGYETVTAQDGEEALNKIRSEDPDLIILDIIMPKKDGFGVLQEIRTNPPSNKWQPVIIVSVKKELDDIKKGYNLEADYYLTKPCSLDKFVAGVETMLSLITARRTQKPGQK